MAAGADDDRAEHRQAEASRCGNRPGAMVGGTVDAVLRTGRDLVVQHVSGAVAQLCGYQPDELIGRDVTMLIPGNRMREISAAVDAVLSGRLPGALCTSLRRRDGTLAEVSLRLSSVLDDADRLVGVNAVIRGVSLGIPPLAPTPRHQLSDVRRDQSLLPSAVISLDGRLTSANDAFCRLFDRPRTELVGMDAWALRHPRDTLAEEPPGAVADGPEGETTERILARRDGTPVHALVHASPLRRPDGAPDAVAVVVQDLTGLRQAEEALRRQEALFAALVRRASDWALVLDAAGLVRSAYPAAPPSCGSPGEPVVGLAGWTSAHPDDVAAVQRAFQSVVARPGRTEMATFRSADGTGQWYWVEAVFTNYLDDPLVAAVICNRRDVTARVNAERALRDVEARYRVIAETTHEGIWSVDTDGRTLFANRKVADVLGLSLDTVYAGSARQILFPHEPTVVDRWLCYQQERRVEEYELTYLHPDGQTRILRLSINRLRADAGRTEVLIMMTELTATRSAEAELRRRDVSDELTGLANRGLLLNRLEHSLARFTRRTGAVAVLFVDLDQFKLVNESWGHGTGDRLLVEVARRLADAVRSGDTVGRFGGDEFVVICEDVTEQQAGDVAGRLLDALTDPFEVDGQRVYVRASIGIALSPPSAGLELLRSAEAAMYEAKARGRSRVQVFDVGLGQRSSERLELSNDLRDALARDELALQYQPVVDLATGHLLGVEALARWNHPQRGPVSPATFVEVAETTGLSTLLDRWVLRRVSRDAPQLASAMPARLRIAVNISAQHLTDDDLEQAVLVTARSGPLARGQLVLEITENTVMDDPERARHLLERLRDAGIETAIDDFGTGYSSLGYLSRLPVSTLKVDRCFVQNITADPDALAIAASIMELARAMQLTTIAEGVETTEQLTVLRRLGCAAGQGFLWSPAVSPEALAQLVNRLPESRFAVATAQPVPGTAGRRG